ncbi:MULTISPECIES: DUF7681 family protein [Rhizobium/Agrobacterium group]|uniref:Acb2/Tad1 domain-containing protein n=1 Tax=Rhizobium/Agrobacterium group TaxID=227290 RepID=UPI0008DBFE79|nr:MULTISPECIES: hypothetical protein [Rhizobium/Agrobacterium group]MCF1436771.1 cyclic nucleotide-binding protein [Allorhizobium ampelinum]MCF1464929.1 cyclic nucleotide-binding protein [Allorhizobium ampelinum]MCF1495964.1 cyclic nucleotide-binding protein [Allorhizobium ampelinum]MUO92144.1 cyclic nucleotide-binding protein [Agrobacterium vitis]MUZ55460.1 cyclic nucleotide-binding protein [Agrobacterium vitis]
MEGLPLAGNFTINSAKIEATTVTHAGLPVKGYQEQSDENVDLVNENKELEERVLRQIDRHVRNRDGQDIDQAMVQLARRSVQEAFMWLNRAVFQPKRILLPEDIA